MTRDYLAYLREVMGAAVEEWIDFDEAYDEADLKAFLDQRLARYKLPRSIVVLDQLPLTAIGKLDKKLLAEYEVTQ